jgi:hypothetical protein
VSLPGDARRGDVKRHENDPGAFSSAHNSRPQISPATSTHSVALSPPSMTPAPRTGWPPSLPLSSPLDQGNGMPSLAARGGRELASGTVLDEEALTRPALLLCRDGSSTKCQVCVLGVQYPMTEGRLVSCLVQQRNPLDQCARVNSHGPRSVGSGWSGCA